MEYSDHNLPYVSTRTDSEPGIHFLSEIYNSAALPFDSWFVPVLSFWTGLLIGLNSGKTTVPLISICYSS